VRLAAWVAISGGLVLAGAILVGSTFSRADAGQRATDLVRSELTEDGLARHRADFELARAGIEEFYGEALPAFAREVGTSPAAFEQVVARDYPAIDALTDPDTRAEGFTLAHGIVTNLEQHQHDFEEADAIPVGWLPMTAGPWIGMVFAGALVASGVWALFRPTVLPLALIGALGLVLLVMPLATRFPAKANAADRLLDTLNVTPEIAAHTRDVREGVGAAIDESEERFYPDLARALGVSRQELDDAIEQRFPAVADLRADRDALFERYERRVQIREGGLDVIPEAKKFPLRNVVRWTAVTGAVVALASAVALVSLRSSSRA
jgi:hypothetical protein